MYDFYVIPQNAGYHMAKYLPVENPVCIAKKDEFKQMGLVDLGAGCEGDRTL